MDYSQYKTDFYRRWQIRMWRYSLILAGLVFVLDVFVTVYYHFNPSLIYPVAFRHYFEIEICVPVILQLMLLFLEGVLLFKKNLTATVRNRVNVYTIFTQFSIISIFHNRYEIVMLLPSLVMLLSALLADKKLLTTLYWCTLGCAIASIAVFFLTNINHEFAQKLIFSLIVYCVQLAMYFVAKSIMAFQKAQLHHVCDNYSRMSELSTELKMEPLTRLYNRTAYADAVSRYVKLAEKSGDDYFQVICDMDDFKNVNDKYGHAAGDIVLISLAEIITKNLSSNRNAFRYGGDEFVILFNDKNRDEVYEIVDKIRKDFFETIYELIDPEFRSSISVGIAQFKKGMSAKDWFVAADNAAYQAKTNGKNCCVIAD